MSRESALAAAQTPAPTVAPDPVDTTPPADGTPPVQDQADAARFASIARKEAAAVKLQQDAKRERDALAAEKAEIAAIKKKEQDFSELKGKDPIAALKLMGFSETDIFNYMANQPTKVEPTPEEKAAKAAEAAAKAQIKAFRDEQAQKAKEAEAAKDSEIIEGLKTETSTFIEANKATMPLCAHYGQAAVDQALEIIKENLKTTEGKELLTVKEALEMTESFYKGELDELMAKTGQKKPEETAPEAPTAPVRTRTVTPGDPSYKQPAVVTRTRTLSNNTGVTSGSAAAPKNETREQKKDRLSALIRANGLRK